MRSAGSHLGVIEFGRLFVSIVANKELVFTLAERERQRRQEEEEEEERAGGGGEGEEGGGEGAGERGGEGEGEGEEEEDDLSSFDVDEYIATPEEVIVLSTLPHRQRSLYSVRCHAGRGHCTRYVAMPAEVIVLHITQFTGKGRCMYTI